MSGAPGDRWRGGGRGGYNYDSSRPRPRHQGGGPSRERSSVNNNNHGHDRHGLGVHGSYHQVMPPGGPHYHRHHHPHHPHPTTSPPTTPPPPPHHHHNNSVWNSAAHVAHLQDHHVPVKHFNSAEAMDMLRQNMSSQTSGPAPMYRPPPIANTKGGPWGSKPNCMASGRDFFLELRKQVSVLQQAKSASA